MPVRLLYADENVVALPMNMLGFSNGEFHRFTLIVAVADHAAVMVDHVPTI